MTNGSPSCRARKRTPLPRCADNAGPEAAVRLAGDLKLFEIVVGIAGFAICFTLTVIILLSAEGFLSRKGTFGGAGAAIVWPSPPR